MLPSLAKALFSHLWLCALEACKQCLAAPSSRFSWQVPNCLHSGIAGEYGSQGEEDARRSSLEVRVRELERMNELMQREVDSISELAASHQHHLRYVSPLLSWSSCPHMLTHVLGHGIPCNSPCRTI
jgi:hypothetical protein